MSRMSGALRPEPPAGVARRCAPLSARVRRGVRWAMLVGGVGLTLWLTGCATDEGDVPWNAPQPWEGTLPIPGLGPD